MLSWQLSRVESAIVIVCCSLRRLRGNPDRGVMAVTFVRVVVKVFAGISEN